MVSVILAILKAFLGYASKRDDARTAEVLETIKAQVEANQAKADIVRAQLGHPVAWIPRFVIELFSAVYFSTHVADRLFDLPGDIAPLPAEMAALLSVIIGGMFLSTTFGKR